MDLFMSEKKVLGSLTFIFCSDSFLLKINQDYLSHNDLTDIITFDLSDSPSKIDGEIYISIDRVKDNSSRYMVPFNQELWRVVFHGCLHLCGFKDKKPQEVKTMRQKELKYLKIAGKL